MIRRRISCSLLALAFFISPSVVMGHNGVPAEPETTSVCLTGRPLSPIPANAEQVANLIGIMPLVQRVRVLACGRNQVSTISVEELAFRQQITEAVLTASLDVDGISAEIDYERAQILDLRELLSKANDRRVHLLTLASIVAGTGSGVVGTAMQFSNRTAIAGDIVGVAGGSAGVILTVLGLRQPGRARSLGIAPNMLAPIFGRRPELQSVYPQDVWTYLNTPPATDPRVNVPWKDELITEWVRQGRIGAPNAPGSQKKIDQLTSRIAEHERLSIGSLTDRSAMLADLGARVSLMNRDLRDLTKAVSIPTAP